MNFQKILEDSIAEIRRQYPAGTFRDKDLYTHWIAQTYHFVCHSTPLLGFALPHLKDENLRRTFEHHLGEESRHDLLALKDLEKLGTKPSEHPVSPWTEAFYHSQYYRIQFEGGTALMGYILFLEAIAVTLGKEIYEEVKDIHKGSALFLKVHAEEDISHVSRAIAVIESLPQDEQEKICANLKYSKTIYLAILDEGKSRKLLKVA